ncbi:MAG: hypothetical protein J7502_05265, partial [Flavisolibacter sp.]|nr:hypothetical protein [Flavisolibacter sp.]
MAKDLINGYVDVENHNGITTIEFFHPQSNSLPHRILEALANEIYDAGTDPDTKVIILRSAGEKAFCAGAAPGAASGGLDLGSLLGGLLGGQGGAPANNALVGGHIGYKFDVVSETAELHHTG